VLNFGAIKQVEKESKKARVEKKQKGVDETQAVPESPMQAPRAHGGAGRFSLGRVYQSPAKRTPRQAGTRMPI
jgi:hypothetical protein